jgi:hypothetical protein
MIRDSLEHPRHCINKSINKKGPTPTAGNLSRLFWLMKFVELLNDFAIISYKK